MRINITLLEVTTCLVSALIMAAYIAAGKPFPADAALFVGSAISAFLGLCLVVIWLRNDLRR